MITINNLKMGFSQRTLFDNVTFSIFPNEKIGLTGPNGAGKTTLFSIILGEMEPIAGNVQLQKNLRIGFLPQESHFDSKWTVMEELTSGDARIQMLVAEKHKLEDEQKADSTRYGDVMHELEVLGIYELEHKAEKILSGLGFKEEDFYKPVAHLSGGWQMRTLLAKLLVYPYDLLLLDEPTNYLDLDATLWLKDYLKGYQGAFVLISHDRIFLNEVTNYTIILEGASMAKIKGNYEEYEEQKDTNNRSMEKKQKVIDQKRKQLERFTERFHAQPNRASAVKNKQKMLDRMEDVDISQSSRSVKDFAFPPIEQSGYSVLTLKNIAKSYGPKMVYESLDFEIIRGQKICLVGPNGAGKSTLLKMVAGAIEADAGTITLGHNVGRGYFSQTRLDVLSPNRTAFEEVGAALGTGNLPRTQIQNLLGLFNFRGDDVFKTVQVLSGGEKSRLILAKLLINPPNFMLLDEPTTHLDLDGVKALTKAFQKYDGTVCFISHDLFFIREVADTVVEVNHGKVTVYPGGLEYYLDKKRQAESARKEAVKEEKNKIEKEVKNEIRREKKYGPENEALNQLKEDHQKAIKRITEIKNQIKALDKEQQELETESYVKTRTISESYQTRDQDKIKEFGRRLKEIQSRLREIGTLKETLEKEKRSISGGS